MASSKTKSPLGIAKGCITSPPPDDVKSENKSNTHDRDDADDDDFLTDVKNEQLVLGQVLSNDICKDVFAERCTYTDFLTGNHKVIAFCIEKALSDGVQLKDDIFDVYRYEYPGEDNSTGGISYIVKLRQHYSENLTKATFLTHVKKLKSDALKHKMHNIYVKKMLRLSRDPSATIESFSDLTLEMENQVTSASIDAVSSGFKDVAQLNIEHEQEIENRKKAGFGSTGFRFLDHALTEAYAPKKVSIHAGRPGMGKSAYVFNSMLRMANRGIPNCIFSLEMDAPSVIDRFNAIETGIDLSRLIKDRKDLSADELAAEQRVKKKREKKPIFINDAVGKTLADVKRELRTLVVKHGVKVCFIDLFMKLRKPRHLSNKSTADQYTWMLNEVQIIAKELNVHIGLVVQIGRKSEQKTDKRPAISDLKDSGGFEEIADLILLFYREAYYINTDVDKQLDVDIAEIIIGKQRQGVTGTVKAVFNGATTKFSKANEEDIELFDKMLKEIKPKRRSKKYEQQD